MHFAWKQENYLIVIFFHIAAAQSDRGDQGDNQEKFGQVSESPGQRNQNPQGNLYSTISGKKLAILV